MCKRERTDWILFNQMEHSRSYYCSCKDPNPAKLMQTFLIWHRSELLPPEAKVFTQLWWTAFARLKLRHSACCRLDIIYRIITATFWDQKKIPLILAVTSLKWAFHDILEFMSEQWWGTGVSSVPWSFMRWTFPMVCHMSCAFLVSYSRRFGNFIFEHGFHTW